MTKQKAIKKIKEFIKYKKFCVSVMDVDSFSTELEDVRQGMVRSAQRDTETLEMILKELETKKNQK